jgi:hypothetical protein
MNIHDAVTCTIFNNYYSPKESVIDAIKVRRVVDPSFFVISEWGARYLTGENLEVVWAEF